MTPERIAQLRVVFPQDGNYNCEVVNECLDAIEELQAELDSRLPTLASLRGSMPDLTDGEGCVAYVRRIRDAGGDE